MKKRQSGFTLVELSIVLVIIGLITGGVLVGQDLIAAAKMRAQVRQLQDYNVALNAFKEKYDNLPGDCDICTTATGFDLQDNAGDGDGVIEGGIDDTANSDEATETFLALGEAGMVSGSYAAGGFPETDLGSGEVALLSDTSGRTYWLLGLDASTGLYALTANGLTGYQAWKLDGIIDDEAPGTGKSRLAGTSADGTTAGSVPDGGAAASHDAVRTIAGEIATCATDISTGTYAFDNESSAFCSLVIRTDG